MNETPCDVCGLSHVESSELCSNMRKAAALGAQPSGVPLRVYGGYLEARAALRANAPDAAIRVLQWLLGHLADQCGGAAAGSFSSKLEKLCDDAVISSRVQATLFPTALSSSAGPERAWALMSIVEHALYRLYLTPPGGGREHVPRG